ncbi:MAG: helicase-related protein, partial [Burkholderiaceae bacterium]
VLVFTRTKHGANRLAEQLNKDGISAMAIHGNKSQGARTRALSEFKGRTLRVLVATDIAARGIDIAELPHVVNYELPNVPEDYVHRIGRTGRAGADGEALSLVCIDELKFLADIERLIKRSLPREVVPGFELDPNDRPEPIELGGGRRINGGLGRGAPRSARPAGGAQDGRRQPSSGGAGHEARRSAPGGGGHDGRRSAAPGNGAGHGARRPSRGGSEGSARGDRGRSAGGQGGGRRSFGRDD